MSESGFVRKELVVITQSQIRSCIELHGRRTGLLPLRGIWRIIRYTLIIPRSSPARSSPGLLQYVR